MCSAARWLPGATRTATCMRPGCTSFSGALHSSHCLALLQTWLFCRAVGALLGVKQIWSKCVLPYKKASFVEEAGKCKDAKRCWWKLQHDMACAAGPTRMYKTCLASWGLMTGYR